jgi:hypothetical protein
MSDAVAALAPYVNSWPLLVAPIVGIALSVTGILIARRTESRLARRVGILVQALTLGAQSLVAVGFLAFLISTFLASRRERFLIPAGYMGDVYVIYNVADGELPSQGETTFRVPPDGIVRSRGPMFTGPTRTAYFYEQADGSLEKIGKIWVTTIPETPENVSDKMNTIIFFPRTGTLQASATACMIEFEQFYVGTKAHLFSEYHQKNLYEDLAQHPVSCTAK